MNQAQLLELRLCALSVKRNLPFTIPIARALGLFIRPAHSFWFSALSWPEISLRVEKNFFCRLPWRKLRRGLPYEVLS